MGSRLTPVPLPLDPASRAERRARVEAVARLVRDGRYWVPADRVAGALIGFYRRQR